VPFDSKSKKAQYAKDYTARPEIAERRRKNFAVWREQNKERITALDAKRRLEKRAQILVANARCRARAIDVAFDLDKHTPEIQQRLDLGVCELTGEPFDFSPGRTFASPSIDRIDPAKGYTYSNIRVVLFMVNTALGNWGEDVLRRVMTRWIERTATASLQARRRGSSKRSAKREA
jgi:hypothetical protein